MAVQEWPFLTKKKKSVPRAFGTSLRRFAQQLEMQSVLTELPKLIPWEGELLSALDFIPAAELLAKASPPFNLSASWKATELKS